MSSKYAFEQSEFDPALMSPRWMVRSIVGSALIWSTRCGISARLSGPYGKSPMTATVMCPLFASFAAEEFADGVSGVVAAESLLQDTATNVSATLNSEIADSLFMCVAGLRLPKMTGAHNPLFSSKICLDDDTN